MSIQRMVEGQPHAVPQGAGPPPPASPVPLPVPGRIIEEALPPPLPYAFARKFGVVLDMGGPELRVALREGADPKALLEVRRVVGRPFDIEVVAAPAFDRLLGDAYAMDGQANALAAVGMGELDLLADGIPTAEDLLDTADDAPAIRLINGVIADAARNCVSDIHVEPYETGLVVRMRIDGVLRETLRMPPHVAQVVVRPDQGHGAARHRRAAGAAGRADGADARRQAARRPRLDAAERGRASGWCCASSTRRTPGIDLDALGMDPAIVRAAERGDRRAERHRAGDWADRQRQDDLALRRAASIERRHP